jgi:hypothetical protein
MLLVQVPGAHEVLGIQTTQGLQDSSGACVKPPVRLSASPSLPLKQGSDAARKRRLSSVQMAPVRSIQERLRRMKALATQPQPQHVHQEHQVRGCTLCIQV